MGASAHLLLHIVFMWICPAIDEIRLSKLSDDLLDSRILERFLHPTVQVVGMVMV